MTKATKGKQISCTMPDRVGLLADVAAALAAAKVNINAICGYGMEGSAVFMVLADSPAKARKVLTKLGAQAKEEAVIVVEMQNKVGEMQKVGKKIADAGVNISYMYGTTAGGKSATCVLSTSDDKKALKALSK